MGLNEKRMFPSGNSLEINMPKRNFFCYCRDTDFCTFVSALLFPEAKNVLANSNKN